MGGKQTKPTPSAKAGYYPDVEVVQAKHIDPHYGEVRYVRDKRTNQLLVLKEIYVNTKQGFESESDFLHHRVALKHPNVVEIVGFNTVDQTSFCASSYKISVYIEVQEKTLQAQLNDRIFNRQAYSEGELLHIAESLVSALSYFQNKGHAHGDIRPANIFVKANTVKLSDPSLSAHRGASALTLVALYGQKAFLAPELLGNIVKKAYDIKSDKHKADVFSLGVTLLSLATLSNNEDLYNYKLGTLNESLLGERLNQVKARYNARLYDLIRSLLTLDVKIRPDFVTLAKALNIYTAGPVLVQQAPVQYVTQQFVPQQAVLNTVRVNGGLQQGDDLDARIKAALERSNQTYTLASPSKDSTVTTNLNTPVTTDVLKRSFAPALQTAVSGYQTGTLTTGTTAAPTTYTTGTYTTGTLGNGEVVKRSYAPGTYTSGVYTTGTTVLPGTYTSGTYTTGEGVLRSYAPGTYTTGTYTTGTTVLPSTQTTGTVAAGSTTDAARKSSTADSKTDVTEKKAETTTATTTGTTTTGTVLPAGYATRTYTTGGYTTGGYTTIGGSTEVLKRSYSNLAGYTTGTTVLPGTYTSGTYTTGEGVVRSYAPGTYTSGTYTTGTVLPSTYTTGTVVSGDATTTTTTGTTGTTEVLKRSYAPLTTGTYTTGAYTTGAYTSGEVVKRSYAPTAGYTYGTTGYSTLGGYRVIGGTTVAASTGAPTTEATATTEAKTEAQPTA